MHDYRVPFCPIKRMNFEIERMTLFFIFVYNLKWTLINRHYGWQKIWYYTCILNLPKELSYYSIVFSIFENYLVIGFSITNIVDLNNIIFCYIVIVYFFWAVLIPFILVNIIFCTNLRPLTTIQSNAALFTNCYGNFIKFFFNMYIQ